MSPSGAIAERPQFDLVSRGDDLPVFAFTLLDTLSMYTAYDGSRKLRECGSLVPAYSIPPNREDLVVLRIVVRNGFSHDVATLFLRDLTAAVAWLDRLSGPMPTEEQPPPSAHQRSRAACTREQECTP